MDKMAEISTNAGRKKHLGSTEQEVFERFKKTYPGVIKDIKFDFRLIPDKEIIPTELSKYTSDWNNITCPRIDIIGTNLHGNTTIIEIRPAADWTAISAAIAYRELFKTVFNYSGPIDLGIICESMSSTNKAICRLFKVQIFIV
jgi:hypothetical protein